MGDTFARALGMTIVLAIACRNSPTSAPAATGPSCRDIAMRAELVIARAPQPTRDETTRFYAEVIDLCQTPGLAQRARNCLSRAADVAAARRCPSLPATADTSVDDDGSGGGAPSCDSVVAHAMRVLARGPDAPVSATDRAEEEQLFLRDCEDASATGRHCAIRAVTVDAIDECLTLPADGAEAPADGAPD